ncbi:circumsporozoite protein [Parasphingopyxis marina]|uniref:Circumsporozoite protein n=1 Tax=Parasphingopyxis marina TaxID=2761622 RepID=A0A842I1W8_9SPHN|nr:circumsporozoite protein [Parasphingopyxis marina]MBC2778781.1 circumsporozoite protein [Parasphingopyxis marina]
MTKTFALPLAVAASLGLAACGGSDTSAEEAADAVAEAADEATAAAEEAAADVEAATDEAMEQMDAMADSAGEAAADAMPEEAPAE